MTETVYRTGQAAKEWGVSSYEVRRLCEAGLIDAEFSAGKQWRIPASEVARIKREGVPPIPTPPGSERLNAAPPAKRAADHGLLAPASENLIEADEDVAITERRLKKRKTELELEEVEDRFREREEREAQRQAERETAERERAVRARAEQERCEFTEEWLRYALRSVPHDAPAEVRLDVREQVEGLLATLPVSKKRQIKSGTDVVVHVIESLYGGSTVERLVDGAVEKALKPWRRRKEIEAAIQEAADSLPYQAKGSSWSPSEWDIRATQAAAKAIAGLRPDATPEEIRAAARSAVQPIIKQFEHERACKEVLSWVPLKLHGDNDDDRDQATTAAKANLEALPVGASQRELERARDAALAPTQAAIDKRREQEQAEEARQQDQRLRESVIQSANIRLPGGMSSEATEEALAEVREALDELPKGTPRAELDAAADEIIEQYKADHDQEQNKRRLIEDGLRAIYPYLQKLEREWDFDQSAWALEQEIKPAIREALDGELAGDESPEDVARLVRRMVREELEV